MNKKRSRNQRSTVGLFISDLENAYTYNLYMGAMDAAKRSDTNLIIFPGKSPKAPYEFDYQFNAIYELPSADNIDALILATGTITNFLSHEEFEAFYKRYEGIPLVSISIPLSGISSVLIDNKVGLKKAFSHLIKDHGLRRIAFIRGPESNIEAQERYLVYKEALKENDIEFDPALVCEGDFSFYSASKAINELLEERKVRFDAVSAANDEMALSVMQTLQNRGFRIPADVAIIGFDNVESAKFSTPSLTTVSQPIYEQAQKAFQIALDMINGHSTVNHTLETQLVIRESCGCMSQLVKAIDLHSFRKKKRSVCSDAEMHRKYSFEDRPFINDKMPELLSELYELSAVFPGMEKKCNSLKSRFVEMLSSEHVEEDDILTFQSLVTDLRHNLLYMTDDPEKVVRLEDFFHQARVIFMESALKLNAKKSAIHQKDFRGLRVILNLLLSNVYNRNKTLKTIIPQLKSMGISSCYIYLYENSYVHGRAKPWKFPRTIKLAMSYGHPVLPEKLLKTAAIATKNILKKELFTADKRYTAVVLPLFYMEEQLGFLVTEIDFIDSLLFESLVVEISCALKLMYLMKSRQEIEEKLRNALIELEEYNQQLNDISQTDELTGLLNRRGFLNYSRHDLNVSRRMERDGLLFFADLDGLKKINDTYGHEEGDNAIKAVAVILRKTFREVDILSRIGGDEFTIFTINTSMGMTSDFQKRIYDLLGEYNRTSGKPYKVSISIGAVPFSAKGTENIETLLNNADMMLYEQKRLKKMKQKNAHKQ
ncbi:MAG: GGDEF domain-containing protein [Fibrobacter sp.]|nr:GGDEF domain-containing protein [Fibrobacter sp.]